MDVDSDIDAVGSSGDEVGVSSACTGALEGFSCQTAHTYWKGNGRSLRINSLWTVDDLRVGIGGRVVVVFSGLVKDTDGVGPGAVFMVGDGLDSLSRSALRMRSSFVFLTTVMK